MLLTDPNRLLIKVRPRKRKRHSRRFRGRIYWRDAGMCAYCGDRVPFCVATLDHVIPLVSGGSDTRKENFCIACLKCNNKKGPLELETLDDLDPYNLSIKFQKVTEAAQNRKGHYPEWVAALV